MEDISEKISALLESPDGMNRLKSVAESLLGNGFSGDGNKAEEKKTEKQRACGQ